MEEWKRQEVTAGFSAASLFIQALIPMSDARFFIIKNNYINLQSGHQVCDPYNLVHALEHSSLTEKAITSQKLLCVI